MSKNIKETIIYGFIIFMNLIGLLYLIKNFTVNPIWFTFISVWVILTILIELSIRVIEIKNDDLTNIHQF